MGIRALRPVAAAIALAAAFAVTGGLAVPAGASANACPGWGGNAEVAMAAQSSGGLVTTSIDSSDVVDFYSEAPGGSTWSQTRITAISFPMDMPAIAAS